MLPESLRVCGSDLKMIHFETDGRNEDVSDMLQHLPAH